MQSDTHQNIKDMTSLIKKDKRELINFFIGWKMRNNLVFQKKSEHILKVIHDALRDSSQWHEGNNRPSVHTEDLHETLPADSLYYCQVDAT